MSQRPNPPVFIGFEWSPVRGGCWQSNYRVFDYQWEATDWQQKAPKIRTIYVPTAECDRLLAEIERGHEIALDLMRERDLAKGGET